MKEKLDRVLGLTTTSTPENQFPSTTKDVPFDGGQPMTTAQAAVTPPVTATAESETDSSEYSYFAKLAE